MMKEKLINFMRGRYGYDELSKALLIVSILFTLLSGVRGLGILRILGTATLIVVMARVFSKDFRKNSLLNQKYLMSKNKLVKKYQGIIQRFSQRKEFRFYSCPACSQKIRVPRGKGKITITCPKCDHKFSKVS